MEQEVAKEVELVVQTLIDYKNPEKLNWMQAYRDVLKKLNMEDKIPDNLFLHYVVRGISRKLYLIKDEPFRLVRD